MSDISYIIYHHISYLKKPFLRTSLGHAMSNVTLLCRRLCSKTKVVQPGYSELNRRECIYTHEKLNSEDCTIPVSNSPFTQFTPVDVARPIHKRLCNPRCGAQGIQSSWSELEESSASDLVGTHCLHLANTHCRATPSPWDVFGCQWKHFSTKQNSIDPNDDIM